MAALIQDATLVFSQDNGNVYNEYSYNYDSVIPPSIQRPPISFS